MDGREGEKGTLRGGKKIKVREQEEGQMEYKK